MDWYDWMSCGAAGQYEAVIPYEELEGILK